MRAVLKELKLLCNYYVNKMPCVRPRIIRMPCYSVEQVCITFTYDHVLRNNNGIFRKSRFISKSNCFTDFPTYTLLSTLFYTRDVTLLCHALKTTRRPDENSKLKLELYKLSTRFMYFQLSVWFCLCNSNVGGPGFDSLYAPDFFLLDFLPYISCGYV